MCACLLVVRFHRLAAEEGLDGAEDLLDGAVDPAGDAVEEALRGGVTCEALLAATRAPGILGIGGVGRRRRREKGRSAAEAAWGRSEDSTRLERLKEATAVDQLAKESLD